MKEDFIKCRNALNRIGIKRVATDFYAKPQKRGSVFFVRSPATHDKTASLALYPNSNRFTDFSNGNLSGDIIAFVAYVRGCNQWKALKELQSYYGLLDSLEQDKQETRRRILAQQVQERKRRERKQVFKDALFGEIDRLKHWEDIYRFSIEKAAFEPFSDLWAYCMNELHKISRQLDILCAVDCDSYRYMKTGSCISSDYWQWLLDTLLILSECGAFEATQSELSEIRAQMNFELIKEPGAVRRCDVEW